MSTTQALQVFLIEDLATDRALVKRQITKVIPNAIFTEVTKRADFEKKKDWIKPDLVVADYALGDFNGLEALLYFREKYERLPFIFVTGTLNDEEKVAEAILNGASAYVLKQNLKSLPEKLMSLLKGYQTQIEKAKKTLEAKREKVANFQQLQTLINEAPEFATKSVVLELLQKLSQTA